MLRQSAQVQNAARIEALAHQIQAVRQARLQSVEDLPAMLEPLTQALAALCDETRSTLAAIDHQSREMGERYQAQQVQLETASRGLQTAVQQTQAQITQAQMTHHSAVSAGRAGMPLGRSQFGWAMATAVATGTATALLVSAFWLWLSPPSIRNVLDPKAVAQWLKPAVIEALKPSKSR